MEEESKRVQYLMKYWSHLQLAREYEQLEKNWKKLKKWLENQKQFIKDIPVFTSDIANNHLGMIGAYNNTFDKMQELESGNNE